MSRTSRPAPETPPPSVADRILATASELFYREGVRAVGIQRVIDEAGIAKASLYAHYPSKDELVAACLTQRATACRARIETALGESRRDARGKLLQLFELQDEAIRSGDFRGCPFLNAVSEIASEDHPAKAVTAGQRRWLHDLIGGLVRDAGVENPDPVTSTIVLLYDGASSAALIDRNPDTARQARWAAEQLLGPPPRPARRKRR